MDRNRSQYQIRTTRVPQMVDLLDRILDKGIVIDAWVRIFQAGIDLITVEARVSVASIDTYRKHARPIGLLDLMAWSQPPILKDKASALPSKAKRRSTQVPRGPGERHGAHDRGDGRKGSPHRHRSPKDLS